MFEAASRLQGMPSTALAVFRREWSELGRPGTWWDGAQRVDIARVARAAWGGRGVDEETALPAVVAEAAATVGGDPGVIRAPMVDAWYQRGLEPEPYVELVGISARMSAIDSFHRAMGLALEPFPDPVEGEPSRRFANPPPRRSSRSFAPTVGPPTIPSVLTAVPAESDALWRLSDAMYLTEEEMSRPDTFKGMKRTQIELIAARTSLYNDCFY